MMKLSQTFTKQAIIRILCHRAHTDTIILTMDQRNIMNRVIIIGIVLLKAHRVVIKMIIILIMIPLSKLLSLTFPIKTIIIILTMHLIKFLIILMLLINSNHTIISISTLRFQIRETLILYLNHKHPLQCMGNTTKPLKLTSLKIIINNNIITITIGNNSRACNRRFTLRRINLCSGEVGAS